MKIKVVFFLILLTTLVPIIARTQSITIDSVDGFDYLGNLDNERESITFYIRITGDSSNHTGITNGFRVYSPDGAIWGATVPDTLSHGFDMLFDLLFSMNTFSTDGVGADTVGFGGLSLFQSGLPALFDELAYTITIGPFSSQNFGKTLIIDKSFYPPIGTWTWAGPDVIPTWGGPYVYTFGGYIEESVNLDFMPDTIIKDVYLADLPVVSDSFLVYAWGISGSADFKITEDIDWLELSPDTGRTSQMITCIMTVTDDTVSTYFDSVMVTSENATNSPQFAYIKLIIHNDATDIHSDNQGLPVKFELYQNYPNPFNPGTQIQFVLPKNSDVRFIVYNIYGQTVYHTESAYTAGSHTIYFDGEALPSGIYFYRIISSDIDLSKKMMLLK